MAPRPRNRILYLRSRNRGEPPHPAYAGAEGGLEIRDVADLPDSAALLAHDLIVIPMQSDEVMLGRKRAWLEGIWAQGGAFLANDVVARPYLPFLSPFVAIPIPSMADLVVQSARPHPAFDGLPEDFYVFGGMRGVYGTGHNPPPPGAVVVNTLGHGAYAIDWYLRGPKGGLFFCHGGSDISAFHSEPDHRPNLTRGLMRWIMEQRHEPDRHP